MLQQPSSPTPRFRASLAATLLIAGTIAVGAGANLVRIDSTCATSDVDTHTVVMQTHNGLTMPANPCLREWATAPQGYALIIVGAALFLLGGLASFRRVSLRTLLIITALTFAALAFFYFKMDGYCSDPRMIRHPGLCMKGTQYRIAWDTRGIGIALGALAACVLALIPVTGIARRRRVADA